MGQLTEAITGFQTHTTPVLAASAPALRRYLSLTSVLEGVVILQENPDYVPTEFDEKKKKKDAEGESPVRINFVKPKQSHW